MANYIPYFDNELTEEIFYDCAQLQYTIGLQRRIVSMIFRLIFHTVITAQMSLGEGIAINVLSCCPLNVIGNLIATAASIYARWS